jgi:toxin ParE1/3/4
LETVEDSALNRRLLVTSQSRDDLTPIAVYLADASGDEVVGRRFVERIEQKFNRLAGLPGLLGTPRPDLRADLRSTPLQGYTIFFYYRDDIIEIVNVLHGSKDLIAYFGEGK